MDESINEAALVLASASTPELLRAAYSLTHQIHVADRWVDQPRRVQRSAARRLREQRDLIDAEILRRCGEVG